MFRSATFKLTMWYLAIVMVISIGFSFAIYHFATNELSYGLHNQTERIFLRFPVFNNDPYLNSQGQDISTGAHHILWELVYFNVLVLVSAGVASYFLARRTLEPIEDAHERQKRFTADVSHELRTPLTSLKMGSEVALMDDKANTKQLRAALESNLEDAAKMDMLINSLLRLTKLDENGSEENFMSLKTKQLIDIALAQTQKLAEAKHITIERTGKNLSLIGDNDALTQLLVILIDNAIKYSPEGSVVHVETTQKDGSSQLRIRDRGMGIAADALPHVFDRFYRADSSRTKTASDGYGLGLSIAKLIADKHHATITLTSRVGKGTTAIVQFPSTPKPTDTTASNEAGAVI